MGRKAVSPVAGALIALLSASPGRAEPPPDPVAQALRVQTAIVAARDHLKHNRPQDAIAVLEEELPHVNGDLVYLSLLRDAYTARLKELLLHSGNPDEVERLRQRLRALNYRPPGAAPAAPQPPPVPPQPPPAPLPPPAAEEPPPPDDVPASEDPFQQTPLDEAPAAADDDTLERAALAFAEQRYAEAAEAFACAARRGAELPDRERRAWAYCRLFLVVERINRAGAGGPDWDRLNAEIAAARELAPGPGPLADFADRLAAEVARRRSAAAGRPAPPGGGVARGSDPGPEQGWRSIRTRNFRVLFRDRQDLAEEAGRAAEQARTALFEKWSGARPGAWEPACDLYLHPGAGEFAAATGKSADLPGSAVVKQRGAEVVSRRIDLRLDDPDWLAATLPYETSHLVLVDLFIDQPLPRWAGEAMAVLAQPPAKVARYLRSLPQCRRQGEWLELRKLVQMKGYPGAGAITPFYVESVSLVSFLVSLRGEKHFALFLREAPRYGFEKALARQYGYRSFEELEAAWLRHALGPADAGTAATAAGG